MGPWISFQTVVPPSWWQSLGDNPFFPMTSLLTTQDPGLPTTISNEIGSRNSRSNPTLLMHRSTQEWPLYLLDYQQKEALQSLWVWRDWRRLPFTLLPLSHPLRDSACLYFLLPLCEALLPLHLLFRLTSYWNCCLPPRSQTKPLVPLISAPPPPFYPLSPRSHLLSSPFTLPSASHLGPGCSSWLAPSSNSGSTLDSPRCPAYSLPFIYNKPSLPLYLGVVMSFFFFYFHSTALAEDSS